MLFKATRVYHSEAAPPPPPPLGAFDQTNKPSNISPSNHGITKNLDEKKRCEKNGREKKADEKMTEGIRSLDPL